MYDQINLSFYIKLIKLTENFFKKMFSLAVMQQTHQNQIFFQSQVILIIHNNTIININDHILSRMIREIKIYEVTDSMNTEKEEAISMKFIHT